MTKASIPPCFAPETTSARLTRPDNTQTVDLGGSDRDDTILFSYHALCTLEAGSVRASRIYEDNTERTWPITLSAPDA